MNMNLKKRYLIFLAIGLFTIIFLNSWIKKHQTHKAKDASLLCDFETLKPWDISPESGFILKLSPLYAKEGKYSLEVVYPSGGLPSINTKKLPKNWGNYDYFSFDVFNPQNETLPFNVRLDDVKRRRFNLSYPLKSGWNKVRISRSQIASKIDASNIQFIVLYLDQPRERYRLYFDKMRLEQINQFVQKQEPEGVSKKQTQKAALQNSPFSKRKIVPLDKISAPTQGQIRVPVAKIKNTEDVVLVSGGIPFALGQLRQDKDIAFFDEAGKEIPIACKVLARWPQDNSIRSILVQFRFKIEHLYEYVTMKWGYPSNTSRIQLQQPDWDYPEGFIMMPKEWLCASEVIGEQVPIGQHDFPRYDENIEKNFPRLIESKLKGDLRSDEYYSTPHVFYQLYVRSGQLDYFLAARKELLYYRDNQIILEGPERGRSKISPKARYIYIEALADDYLLTGDEKSLLVAGYMAEYLKNRFSPSDAFFAKDSRRFWTEREAAFQFLGILTYYELTLDKEFLKIADEYMKNLYRTQLEWPERGGFIHNLYSHDPEEGARPDEYGGSPFMTGLLLEPIIEYHRLTGSDIAADSIFRALDWLIKEGLVDSGDSFRYSTADINKDSDGEPDLNLLIVHAFGYGFRMSGYQRRDYLTIGCKVFERGIREAYLGDRKHFNQNYRSSGHFLAYIKNKATKDVFSQTANLSDSTNKDPTNKNIFFSEGFNESVGGFKSCMQDAIIISDADTVYTDGNSLNIKSKFVNSTLCVGIELPNWNIKNYPLVNFSYLIPKGTPVGIRVKTEFQDFVCLGGTNRFKCGDTKVAEGISLLDDGEWHQAYINVGELIGSILPGINHLVEFQFFTDKNANNTDEFWIDDFKIKNQ